jgi:predicted deacetylase
MELIVSLHDVAPSKAELCRRWLDELERLDVRASLLVVPGLWNGQTLQSAPHFVEWLKAAQSRGHEIVLHGYCHSVDPSFRHSPVRGFIGKLLGRGCEEFWSLPFTEAKRRLQLGVDALRVHGFSPRGFVAPGWLMSPDTYLALKSIGFEYTTTHYGIITVSDLTSTRVITLSQRPQSILSKMGIAVNYVASTAFIKSKKDFRLAVHPNDLINKRVRDSNIRIIQKAMNHGYDISTYGQKIDGRLESSQSLVHKEEQIRPL